MLQVETLLLATTASSYISSLLEIDKKKLLLIVWIAAVILLIIVTAILSLLIPIKWAICISAAFWAILFGATGLLYLSPKTITTSFGALIGFSSSDAATGAGVITGISRQVTEITRTLSLSLPDASSFGEFASLVVWMFFVILGVLMLPAFFYEK